MRRQAHSRERDECRSGDPGILFGNGGHHSRREERHVDGRDIKEDIYDFCCAHTENQGIYGYDLTTQLGSNLTFTRQRAALEDRGAVEIVRQNFGFDLRRGVKSVELDPAQEHYYLEVRRRR